MFGSWTTHHTGEIGGRQVQIKTYSDGGYCVSTTLGKDYDGEVYGDDSSTVIMPPRSKGEPIDIDAETIDELCAELAEEGFDQASIDEIVSHFP